MIKFPDLNIALTCPLGGIIFTLFRRSCQKVAKHVVLSHYLQEYCRGPYEAQRIYYVSCTVLENETGCFRYGYSKHLKEALKEALDAATQIQDECYRAKTFAGLESLDMSIFFLCSLYVIWMKILQGSTRSRRDYLQISKN